MGNISFKKPKFDGMFFEIEVKLLPKTKKNPFIHLKHRCKFQESELHISIPTELQGQGLAGKIIKEAVEQLSEKFGLLVIAKARITNPYLFKVIDKLIIENNLSIVYNTQYDRWEFSPKTEKTR